MAEITRLTDGRRIHVTFTAISCSA